jgi:NhaP-type Na+/H+ or K+/H+ antiporter
MSSEEGSEENIVALLALVIIVILLFYVIGGSFIEHRKLCIGHETGIAIILGFIVSLIAWAAGLHDVTSSFQFSGTIFFYLCLPPIIFASGFNMRRKRFFANIGYITLLGLFGTIFTFIMFSVLLWAFM